jgi:general transcription factor 3C polypeptide 3 (transcription factor C subunit 4)
VASDADSDLEELEGDMAKFDESVRQFLAGHRGSIEGLGGSSSASGSRGGPSRRGQRITRGPRRAAKPRGDITARLAKVNQAFLAGDYATALDLASEVVRINAETHQAWTTLSSIFAEIGDVSKALSAMVYAAHLRPKNVEGWLNCASYATEHAGQDEEGNLHTARLCYSAALKADGSNLKARLGKASICHQQGHLGSAIADYKYYLNRRPHDLDIVRKLAEACVDNRHTETAIPTAISAYRRYFDIETSQGPSQPTEVIWHDIGNYVELFASVDRYVEAIRELRSLARWVVGRQEESYWVDWQQDDREWDVDHDRRIEVPSFAASGIPPVASEAMYGSSLPLDLRARLARYRLGLADVDEALVGSHGASTRWKGNIHPRTSSNSFIAASLMARARGALHA